MKSFTSTDLLLAYFVREKAHAMRRTAIDNCKDHEARNALQAKPIEDWVREAYRLANETAQIMEMERIRPSGD